MRFHSVYGIMHVFTSELIHQKEGGPDRYVSNNIFSSVTHSEPAMKAREMQLIIGKAVVAGPSGPVSTRPFFG